MLELQGGYRSHLSGGNAIAAGCHLIFIIGIRKPIYLAAGREVAISVSRDRPPLCGAGLSSVTLLLLV